VPFVLDLSKEGFEKVFRDYQIEAMRAVWSSADEGVTSRDVYLIVNGVLGDDDSVSRASIINFLNGMCDEGVLTYVEETCKGGVRRKYFPGMDESGFKRYIVKTVVDKMVRGFPTETIDALRESLGKKAKPIKR